MSRCRSCGAPVVWARTTKGRNIPLDGVGQGDRIVPAEPANANLAFDGWAGPLRVVRVVPPGDGRWVSHFVTCPNAREHRR